MHVLQIAPYFPPYIGGQEKYVYHLSLELVRQGHQVTVLTSNVPKGKKYEKVNGINIFRYTSFARPLRNPIALGILFSSKIPTDIDIIHAHNEHSFSSNLSVIIKKKIDRPLVITCHGKLVFGSPGADFARKIYEEAVGKLVLNQANKITVATPAEKRRIVQSYGLEADGIDIVPVGVDIDFWNKYKRVARTKKIGSLDLKDRKVLLVATQLIKRKGIHFLIRALPAVAANYPNIVLLIAGKGPDELYFRKLVIDLHLNDKVIFLGQLNEEQLAQAYQNDDIFILPSLGEGQPTCIMEAWNFSNPVIATRIEGVIDYFDDIAYLVNPADPKDLSEGISYLLGNPEIASLLGRKGEELIKSSFSWSRIALQMMSTYENVLNT